MKAPAAFQLPLSTIFVIANHLESVAGVVTSRDWADELTTAGVDHAAVIELALLEGDAWQTAIRLVPEALEAVGVPLARDGAIAALRDLMVARLSDPAIDPESSIKLALNLYCRLDHGDGVLADFISLENDYDLLRDGIIGDPSFDRLGVRQWAIDYLTRET